MWNTRIERPVRVLPLALQEMLNHYNALYEEYEELRIPFAADRRRIPEKRTRNGVSEYMVPVACNLPAEVQHYYIEQWLRLVDVIHELKWCEYTHEMAFTYGGEDRPAVFVELEDGSVFALACPPAPSTYRYVWKRSDEMPSPPLQGARPVDWESRIRQYFHIKSERNAMRYERLLYDGIH